MTLPDSTRDAARRSLRAGLVARRRALSPGERTHAARRVAENADRFLHLKSHWRIAAYAALPGELDAGPLIERARERGCRVYVPRIGRQRSSRAMRFLELGGRMRRNRLGIEEPEDTGVIGARWLDIVFLPLVGFDRFGLRLGAGGGFYDRAFSFRHARNVWHAPRLIGIAYAFQELERIEPAAHDVPLDAVITEKGVVRCVTG